MKPPKAIKRLTNLIKRINAVNLIVEDSMSWETKYSLVFSEDFSVKIKGALAKLDIELQYYDPDTDYQDDVLAFVRALNDKLPDLIHILEALQKMEENNVLQISKESD